VSFILDALRKSEHERQQAAGPGLSQVPLATPPAQLPRWVLVVIGVLAATVLVLGGAWWQASRSASGPTASAPPLVERRIELPAPTAPRPSAVPQQAAAPTQSLSRPGDAAAGSTSLAAAAASSDATGEPAPALTQLEADPPTFSSRQLDLPADAPALPSATSLAAEGVAVPALRLELHAFSGQPKDRFVFINGRKYVEGERLLEGPELLSIEPTGAVLAYAGRRFVIVQE
jgi:general secretion pathway protein B